MINYSPRRGARAQVVGTPPAISKAAAATALALIDRLNKRSTAPRAARPAGRKKGKR